MGHPRWLLDKIADDVRRSEKIRRSREIPAHKEAFSRERIRVLMGPCVYQYVRDGTVLYVGSSANGIGRPLQLAHHRSAAREDADKMLVSWTATVEDAWELETALILEKQPPMNKTWTSPPGANVRRTRRA